MTKRAYLVAALTLTSVAVGDGALGAGSPAATRAEAASPRYQLPATRRCLVGRGAAVSTSRPSDTRLRALRDLAQHTSVVVRLDGRSVGLALGDTELLVDLLRVPNDPYRVDVRGNAVVMYRPVARPQADVVRSCLRP